MSAKKMKAIVKTKKAPGAELREVEIPKVKPNEVLVKVFATAICGSDAKVYEWSPFFAAVYENIPNIMGHELGGEVVEVGSAVNSVAVGDHVSAESHVTCGHCIQCLTGQQHICANMRILGFSTPGCFAEYASLPESVVWRNDPALPMDIAALQEPLGNAIYCTLVEPVTAKSVVIFGDGPIGLFAVGVAKASGAALVVLVGLDPFRMELGPKMGADVVIDAANEDVITRISELTDGVGADVVLEMAGAAEAVSQGLEVIRKGGRFSAFGLHNDKVTVDYNEILHKGIVIYGIHGRLMFDTWVKAKNLLSAGLLDLRPVITHHLPLEDFEEGFSMLCSKPTRAAKVLLYPDSAKLPKK